MNNVADVGTDERRAYLLAQLVDSLKAAGVWSSIEVLYLLDARDPVRLK